MEKSNECLRCGQCCFYWKFGRRVKCKHLKYNRKLGRTYCSIYIKRNFMLANGENPVIDFYFNPGEGKRKTVICLDREHMKKNYPGCPYNKEEWEDAD